MPLLLPINSWSRRFLCEVSLAAALLLHVLMFGLLQVRHSPARTDNRRNESTCSSFQPGGGAWEQQLLAFSDIHDPSLLTEADARHGFSAVLSLPAASPLSNTTLRTPEPVRQTPAQFPAATVAAPLPGIPETIGQNWPLSLPASPEKIPQEKLPAATLCRFADGTLLTPVPAIPENARELAATQPPTAPCRFEIRLPQTPFQSRIRLTDSCGNPKLDRLALQLLSTRVRQWELIRLTKKNTPETDRFSADREFTQIVEVEWRLQSPPP